MHPDKKPGLREHLKMVFFFHVIHSGVSNGLVDLLQNEAGENPPL